MAFWRENLRQVEPLALPLLLSIFVAAALAVPDQIHEIYRTIAQDLAEQKANPLAYRELILAVLGIVAVSFATWLTARQAVMLAGRAKCDHASLVRWALCWVPRLLATVPPIAAAVGLLHARVDSEVVERMRNLLQDVFVDQFLKDGHQLPLAKELSRSELKELMTFNDLLLVFAIGLIILAVVVFLIVLLLDRSATVRVSLRPSLAYALGVVLFGAAIIVLFLSSPVLVPQQIGIIGLFGLFLCVLLFATTQLQTLGVVIALLITILLSAFDLNDNHAIRVVQSENPSGSAQTTIKNAFARWWETRKDQAKFQAGQRYPVYVVAAQGGGIYAADHVAEFLAGMQDLCPNFAHHLFAISGVSGGSVGATAFASLTRELGDLKEPSSAEGTCFPPQEGRRPTFFVDTITEVFRRDLLSPLGASLFFPDFFQRFIPVPIGRFDRARPLEYAFEEAYARGIEESGLGRKLAHPAQTLAVPFLNHWDPKTYPDTPALVLNTTEVESGERRVISPFIFEGSGLGFLPIWSDDLPPPGEHQITLPLSTAAFLSARFPWITPAAWFQDVTDDECSTRKVRLVDGGYFENSGVATAADIIEGLIESIGSEDLAARIDITLIVFSSAGFQTPRHYGWAESLEPIRAMLNTRSARAGIEIDKALKRLRSLSSQSVGVSAQLVKLELQGYGYPLPLGWRLSPVTRHLISYQDGLALECDQKDEDAVKRGKGIKAGCVKKLIYDKLK